MKKADGTAGVGLTELTVLGNKVVSSTSSEISIQVDGKKLEHFNPSKTDYYIPQSSKEITATASNNGLVTVVPATSEKGATRLILKASDKAPWSDNGSAKNPTLPPVEKLGKRPLLLRSRFGWYPRQIRQRASRPLETKRYSKL